MGSSSDCCESIVSSQDVQVYLVHSLTSHLMKRKPEKLNHLPKETQLVRITYQFKSSVPEIISASTLSGLKVWRKVVRALWFSREDFLVGNSFALRHQTPPEVETIFLTSVMRKRRCQVL